MVDDSVAAPAAATTSTNAEKEVDAAAVVSVAPGVEEPVEESPTLRDLLLLPPMSQATAARNGVPSDEELLSAVPLPPIRAEEAVASIRTALSEVCGLAHVTSYRLELVVPPNATNSEALSFGEQRKQLLKARATGNAQQDSKKKAAAEQDGALTVSPYTGKDAVVSVPAMTLKEAPSSTSIVASKSLVLDDYGDLTTLLEVGLTDGAAFRIILERYDVAAVRDHVTRLRSLVDGNAPTVTSFLDESVGEEDEEAVEGGENGAAAKEQPAAATTNKADPAAADENPASEENGSSGKKAEEPAAAAADAAKAAEEAKPKPPLPNMPKYELEQPIVVDGSNMEDYFYSVCGEDPNLYHNATVELGSETTNKNATAAGRKKKKKNKNKQAAPPGTLVKANGINAQPTDSEDDKDNTTPVEQVMRKIIPRLHELEEIAHVKCSVRFSGFHPPPAQRRWMGDLAYLELSAHGQTTIMVTAMATGFYVNKSTATNFDPAPAITEQHPHACFSHELLDCWLQASPAFSEAWASAITASKERAELIAKTNRDGPFSSLFRVAVRGDFGGYSNPATASAYSGIDALLQTPSWLVPIPNPRSGNKSKAIKNDWTHNSSHNFNWNRTEDDLCNTLGVDIRSGAVRDWNEELQSAREMPTATLTERIERARVLHKTLNDFGEAAVVGVKAIADGHISAMNPNEAMRSQVYLHNNIFFSRAVDAGVETFKISRGDQAARKSASRDVQCIGTLHRMEKTGLYTLATVLIDYLGTRFVCQSILPGILSGDKTHTLLYGAVEAGSALTWDQDMHEALEKTLGKTLSVATRKMPKQPLRPERLAEIQEIKKLSPLFLDKPQEEKKDEENDFNATIDSCAPLEAKGIRGSDQRKYVLDLGRLTPRDANWVPKEKGGTGVWEAVNNGGGKAQQFIPSALDDDEWTLAVLRPELVQRLNKMGMDAWYKTKKAEHDAKEAAENAKEGKDESADEPQKDAAEANETVTLKLTEEDMEHLKSFRMNVNVFLPDVRSIVDVDSTAADQLKSDEEKVREASRTLWEQTLPKLTRDIRDGTAHHHHQAPPDGRSLTEMLHQRGVNCRYIGRLAMLAQDEEEKDRKVIEEMKQGTATQVERRTMPLSWLELLECEMVARAAKHVLDSYLTENGGSVAVQPSQTIASFLSALISESEETAAQTETRMGKNEDTPDDDEFSSLTIFDTGGDGGAVPPSIRSRTEVWEDIEREVGRRFRYSLTLYNTGGKESRALHAPLLRRICQRTGVRLAAKNYEIGGKCLCSGGNTAGGRLTASYPIAPTDILDIVPLMKHSAAHNEGFIACSLGASVGLPSLHISLPDARNSLEAAHIHCNGRSLSRALEFAQEAANLYQRVTDSPAHPGVIRCIDLMATILCDANEPNLAADSALKSLGLSVQVGGFDSADTLTSHLLLFQLFMSSGQMEKAGKHIKAAMYLMEQMGGPRYAELSNAYHKIGTLYHSAGDLWTALRFYREAGSRAINDRLQDGMIAKSTALVLAAIGQYKVAIQSEKRAYHTFSLVFGEDHQMTKASDQSLKNLMKAAVHQGNMMLKDDQKRKEEEAAEAMASQIEAEAESEEKKKKKNAKKKKGKK